MKPVYWIPLIFAAGGLFWYMRKMQAKKAAVEAARQQQLAEQAGRPYNPVGERESEGRERNDS